MSTIPKDKQLYKAKKLKTKKCKYSGCKKDFVPVNQKHICCGWKCGVDYAKEKEAKRKSSEHRKAKKEYLQNDKSHLMKVAQNTFNKYIRMRDKGNPCISCDHIGSRQIHAGHFMPVGSNGHIRFDEDNCHSQCSICNNHKSGNLIEYEPRLVLKIGQEEVDRLKTKIVKQWTIEELKEIIEIFKIKTKDLS